MKLLIDANLSHQWVDWLARAGFESVHWSSLGAGDAPDSMIMKHARDQSYVILTLDLDFGIDLANTHNTQPSVVQVRCHFAHSEDVRDHVTQVLRETAQELEQGALITINSNRFRIRPLPIG